MELKPATYTPPIDSYPLAGVVAYTALSVVWLAVFWSVLFVHWDLIIYPLGVVAIWHLLDIAANYKDRIIMWREVRKFRREIHDAR